MLKTVFGACFMFGASATPILAQSSQFQQNLDNANQVYQRQQQESARQQQQEYNRQAGSDRSGPVNLGGGYSVGGSGSSDEKGVVVQLRKSTQ